MRWVALWQFLWGQTHLYNVEFDATGHNGPQGWCGYIDSFQVKCIDNVTTAPTTMQTMTEIHQSGLVFEEEHFTSALIQIAAGGPYQGQYLGSLQWAFPYLSRQTGDTSFDTYHAGIYVPFILKG